MCLKTTNCQTELSLSTILLICFSFHIKSHKLSSYSILVVSLLLQLSSDILVSRTNATNCSCYISPQHKTIWNSDYITWWTADHTTYGLAFFVSKRGRNMMWKSTTFWQYFSDCNIFFHCLYMNYKASLFQIFLLWKISGILKILTWTYEEIVESWRQVFDFFAYLTNYEFSLSEDLHLKLIFLTKFLSYSRILICRLNVFQ